LGTSAFLAKQKREAPTRFPLSETSPTTVISQNICAEARKIVGIGIIAMSIPRIIMP
jgi:hypothetical protein